MIRLAGLAVHPVKSTATRHVRHAEVESWGLADDRRWMVVGPDAECLTAREDRTLLTLVADTTTTDPTLSCGLRLSAPGTEPVEVPTPDTDAVPVSVTVHGRGLTGRPAGDHANDWLRAALGRDDVTLVHVADPRPLDPRLTAPGEATAFADGYPVTLASAASLRRLDTWVTETSVERGEAAAVPLAMDRFRPNLVVDGDLEPFEEDRWQRVRVGTVTFRVVTPVDRCVMTTVDPTTRRRGPEPIRTLARHRAWDGATWFAVQLVPEVRGTIRRGDEVHPDR